MHNETGWLKFLDTVVLKIYVDTKIKSWKSEVFIFVWIYNVRVVWYRQLLQFTSVSWWQLEISHQWKHIIPNNSKGMEVRKSKHISKTVWIWVCKEVNENKIIEKPNVQLFCECEYWRLPAIKSTSFPELISSNSQIFYTTAQLSNLKSSFLHLSFD